MEYKLNPANTGRFDNIIYLENVGSTNDYLKSGDFPCGTAVFAGVQTAGRGRRGRQWDSRESLCFSVLIRGLSPPLRPLLPFICGLAVCGAAGSGAALKWPNDVLIGKKKICGILCETLYYGKNAVSICGIGLNISGSREFYDSAGLPGAGSVFSETGTVPHRAKTAETVLRLIGEYIEKYAANPAGLICEYKEKCLTLGKYITAENAGTPVRGTAAGIAPDGALIISTPNGETAVYSGETSL